MWRVDSLERPWWWEGLEAEGEREDRGWDGWMASPTRWGWVWVNFRSWWWTGRPGVLQFMGSQRVRHDWVTELNWTDISLRLCQHHATILTLNLISRLWIHIRNRNVRCKCNRFNEHKCTQIRLLKFKSWLCHYIAVTLDKLFKFLHLSFLVYLCLWELLKVKTVNIWKDILISGTKNKCGMLLQYDKLS